jgi:hypothetical protein
VTHAHSDQILIRHRDHDGVMNVTRGRSVDRVPDVNARTGPNDFHSLCRFTFIVANRDHFVIKSVNISRLTVDFNWL